MAIRSRIIYVLSFLAAALATMWLASCAPSTGRVNPSTGSGSGGANVGTGGGSGGANVGTGGTPGSGGTTGDGGTTGVAGNTATGGDTGVAGRGDATGGADASGGAGRGGAMGGSGTGGRGGGVGTGGTAGGAQCPATATATAGETTQSITVGGMARTFIRHLPPGYTGKTPVPVVIDFHPLGSSGSGWKGSTGWGSLADKEGFIMIWPDGVGGSWNAGRCCRTALEQNIDDVGFAKAIIATLLRDACIDSKRVYATGCSNGGGMAFKVACDAADVIAAVAPVDFDCVTSAAASDRTCGARCAPSRPISEIQFRGTADDLVPYEGGMRSGGTTTFPGAQQTFMSFGAINMCTGSPQPLVDHPACQTYPMCGGGVQTALCTVQNGTHCGSYQSFGIANIAWQMFATKALP